MGGGASSKKKKYEEEAAARKNGRGRAQSTVSDVSRNSSATSEDLDDDAPGEKKLTRFEQIKAQAGAKKQDDANAPKPCERCGVTGRRTTKMGQSAPWLCSACSMSHGPAALLERPVRGQLTAAALGQPVDAADLAGAGAGVPKAQVVKRANRRKGAKGFANRPKDADPPDDGRQTMRSALSAPSAAAGKDRRQPAGASQVAPSRAGATGARPSHRPNASDGAPGIQDPYIPWPGSGAELAGGWKVGDAVQSLISRARNGTPWLESGHEGCIIGLSPFHSFTDGEEPRFLIQFSMGFDWTLSANQICHPAYFASNRSQSCAGGLDWGDRVRSLVVLLSQSGGGGDGTADLTLGDSGVVLGPGHTKGKLAVRFDHAGEWNIWPSALCREERFEKMLEDRLAGGYRRGDLVQIHGYCSGRVGKPVLLDPGELGMVIGPGHSSGRILVYMEASERPWSLLPSQVVRFEEEGPAPASHPAVPGAVAEICF